MKVKDIDKLREKLNNDKREAFSKHQVWLMLSEHNTEVPTVDAVPMSVIEEIKKEIKALKRAYPVNYVSADDAVDTCLAIIDRYIGKEGGTE